MTTDPNRQRIEHAANDLAKAQHAYRDTIATANANGLSTRTIGTILGVSHQTVHNIIKAHREVSA